MELSKTKQSLYSSLSSKKMRERHGLFVVEGEKGVSDTLGYYSLEALVVRDNMQIPECISQKVSRDKIYTITESGMKKVSSLSTSPTMLAVYCLPERELAEEKELAKDLYLMLDGVQDPGNLGTIIRTAHWFGIKKIFASKETVDLYNPKTIQSTMGSLPYVSVEYVDLHAVLRSNPGMPVYGLLLEGENIYKASKKTYGFIVMGNEGKGLTSEMRKSVTASLLIPPYNPADHGESLNVAIATAITLSCFRGA